jgi:hypothetical protein
MALKTNFLETLLWDAIILSTAILKLSNAQIVTLQSLTKLTFGQKFRSAELLPEHQEIKYGPQIESLPKRVPKQRAIISGTTGTHLFNFTINRNRSI